MYRRLLPIGFVVLALGAGTVATRAQTEPPPAPPPQACDDPTESITMFAERLGPKRIGYGLTPGSAQVPGPTIEMIEGECLAITLVNDTDVLLSMHVHGVDYTVASDGTPINSSCVKPGRSRTYVWRAHAPAERSDGTTDPGSAGYWHYHDHCMGGPHGTAGIKAGLFGPVVVRRQGDPLPDRDPFVVVMGPGSRINQRKAPNTPTFEANQGERVEFVVIGHGNAFHTFHLHGHRWVDNRTGVAVGPVGDTAVIDNRTVGPADSFGFQVVAGEGVGPGAWMYHCHVQGHSDAGMTGLFVVRTPGGLLTEQTQDAIDTWRHSEGAHH
ncbi:MAG: multicopper oxidase domain-containing protein [Actinomycetota bacterium]